MKKIRFTALFMTIVMLIVTLAGCSNSTGRKLSGTVTLKEFLDSGPKVGFYGSFPLDKDNSPYSMYLFENGKVYYVYSFDENEQVTDDYKLTWGEISKMSDKELLEYARKYMTLHKGRTNLRFEFDPKDANIISGNPDKLIKNAGETMVKFSKSEIKDRYIPVYDTEMLLAKVPVFHYMWDHEYKEKKVCYEEFYVDKDGKLYFINGNPYLKGYDYTHHDDNDYEEIDETTPYDGRYGEVKLPAFTFKYDYTDEMTTGDYSLHIVTDGSGNLALGEGIIVEMKNDGKTLDRTVVGLYNYPPAMAAVYDSMFSILFHDEDGDSGLIFRTSEDLELTLDNVGDKGVEVD